METIGLSSGLIILADLTEDHGTLGEVARGFDWLIHGPGLLQQGLDHVAGECLRQFPELDKPDAPAAVDDGGIR